MTLHVEAVSRSGSHPSDEDWERLAMGEYSSEQRLALMDHVCLCPDCAQIFRVLVAVEAGASDVDPMAPDAVILPDAVRTRAWSRPRVWLSAAAAVAAGCAFLLVSQPQSSPLETTETPEEVVWRSTSRIESVVPVGPLGAVSGEPVFSWKPVAEARSYRVQLLDDEGELEWTGEATNTAIPWPATLPLEAGVHYWRVLAELDSGRSVASDLVIFEVAGQDPN
ncbi:MAG: hypothetical protein K8J08_16055 [Thermoanaerobaculia bacterium]|nr:hypothetical protein [Thermoanaerobaculia bacterium]